MANPKTCPNCEEETSSRWARDRKIEDYCDECGWASEPRTPEKKPVRTTRSVDANNFPGFCYEIFDKYGHIMVSSRSYSNQAEALKEIERELGTLEDVDYGPGRAILWPSTVKVTGKLITLPKQKEANNAG